MIFIFIDHIPGNWFHYVTLQSLALSDAAEVFMFISGYTAAMTYGRVMLRDGILPAAVRVWRRMGQLYVAHLCLLVLFTVEIVCVAQRTGGLPLVESLGAGDVVSQPGVTIVRALVFGSLPSNLGILPLYIELFCILPVVMLALRWHVAAALLPSFALYLAARHLGLDLPLIGGGNPSFNPFAWQFLFVIGAVLGYRRAANRPDLQGRRWITMLAGTVAALACLVQVYGSAHHLIPAVPNVFWRLQSLDKGTLSPLRLINFLALAYLAVRCVPFGSWLLMSPPGRVLVLCGRYSLQVFCLGVLMSAFGSIVLTLAGRSWASMLAINATGIAAMLALAFFMQWAQGGGWLSVRGDIGIAGRDIRRLCAWSGAKMQQILPG